MKILCVVTISNTINSFLVPHIKMLIANGHSVDLACNLQAEIDTSLTDLGCSVFDVNFCRTPLKYSNIQVFRQIKKIALNGKYDVIHVHTPIASTITRLACRKLKDTKIIYTAHGFHFYRGAPIKNWLVFYPIEKWLARYTDVLITINGEDYDLAKHKRFKAAKIMKVNGVGIDFNKFSPQTLKKKVQVRREYGYSDDEFILLFAAELNHNKHQDLLIDVVSKLRDAIPKMRLLLAGSGVLREHYKIRAVKMGVDSMIEFLGERNDVPNLLMLSDLSLSSSRREGLPVNVMEAMATGLPLVVTDIRGHRDLVNPGENGNLIKLNDPKGFAAAIKELYDSCDLRKRAGERGLEIIQKYSIENVLKEIEAIYSTL